MTEWPGEVDSWRVALLHRYAECDGAEFEASSLPLDLRFIGDHMQFEKTPRDVASSVSSKCVGRSRHTHSPKRTRACS